MMMHLQEVGLIILLVAALAYLAKKVWVSLFAQKCGQGCGSCGSNIAPGQFNKKTFK